MQQRSLAGTKRGQWMALAAALLGWMFDGFEMGLFPLVGRDALRDLLGEAVYAEKGGQWFAVAIAVFLVGAATGGVLFGWLGDRIGRVRAMTLSVFTYAVFTGLCGLATTAEQIAGLRFVAALGMGGEWSLGVALVNEIWPDRSRAFLAGLIGAAANVGFLLIAVIGLGLTSILAQTRGWLLAAGLAEAWVTTLVGHSGWRLLMFVGAIPALLTFLIRLFVPESERWERERKSGATSYWATRDLLGVLVGSLGAIYIILLWGTAPKNPTAADLFTRGYGTLLGLAVAAVGYIYPVLRYLHRSEAAGSSSEGSAGPIIRRMLLAACLGGVALLGTWGSLQWAPAWADQMTERQLVRPVQAANLVGVAASSDGQGPWLAAMELHLQRPKNPQVPAKEFTQIWSAIGAIVGTILAALAGDWLGRRLGYTLLCVGSLGSALFFFQINTSYTWLFLVSVFLAGGLTASFYGWLPLYLPELFRTSIRATGQGFSFNFGRILAAVGVLQTGNLMGLFNNDYPTACSIMSLIYVLGVVLIWFAPETRGKPLPE